MNRKVLAYVLLLITITLVMTGCTQVQESDVHLEWTKDYITLKSMQRSSVSIAIDVSDGVITETYHITTKMHGEHSVQQITIQDLTGENENSYYENEPQITGVSIVKVTSITPTYILMFVFGVLGGVGLLMMIIIFVVCDIQFRSDKVIGVAAACVVAATIGFCVCALIYYNS